MKSVLAVLIACYLLIAAGRALVQGATQAKDVEITGRISCAFCSLSERSNCTGESCKAGVGHGNPVVLTDAKGNRYMLISEKKEKSLLTGEWKGLFQKKITVHGKLVKRGGIQGIYVRSMERVS